LPSPPGVPALRSAVVWKAISEQHHCFKQNFAQTASRFANGKTSSKLPPSRDNSPPHNQICPGFGYADFTDKKSSATFQNAQGCQGVARGFPTLALSPVRVGNLKTPTGTSFFPIQFCCSYSNPLGALGNVRPRNLAHITEWLVSVPFYLSPSLYTRKLRIHQITSADLDNIKALPLPENALLSGWDFSIVLETEEAAPALEAQKKKVKARRLLPFSCFKPALFQVQGS
jgi:hypothetical protein